MKSLLFRLQNLFLLILLSGVSTSVVSAQATAPESYRVLLRPMPRMVEVIDEETFVGFEVDLWKEIANRVGFDFTFSVEENFQNVLDKVQSGLADFALATTSIRSDRARQMTFSQPYLTSGISVLVRDNSMGLFAYLSTLFSPLLFQTVGIYLLFCIVFGAVFWWIERKENVDIRHEFWPGVFDGLWHAFKKPWSVGHHLSRILVWPLWVITLLFSSVITAQVIDNYDTQKENYLFRGVPDYSRVVIGVIQDTSSDERLSPREADFGGIVRAETPEELYERFSNKEIDAIVAELPLIIDIQKKANEDRLNVAVRPETLSEELYGIAINFGIDWRMIREIDRSIMELRDNGFIKELQTQWLSEDKQKSKPKVKVDGK